MWKTASASPPSGGRPRLVADHTHKEPCTKTAGRGPVPFYPSPSTVEVSVLFIYLGDRNSALPGRDTLPGRVDRGSPRRLVCVW